jgi:hypothetical protein
MINTASINSAAINTGGGVSSITALHIQLTGQAPGFINRKIATIKPNWLKTLYTCHLTGLYDGLPDLPLQISSFQIRMAANPLQTYLSVVIKGVDRYEAAINARTNGSIVIKRQYVYSDKSVNEITMATAKMDNLAINQGGRAGATGSLTGYELLHVETNYRLVLKDPITRGLSSNGALRYRCAIDPRVRPRDIVQIANDTFTVDTVNIIIDSAMAIMELSGSS